MPRYVLPLLIAAAVAIALALTWWTLGRAGSTEAANVEQDVAPFHRLEVNGGADVVLQHGSAPHISIDAPVRGSRVAADVQDGTLVINVRDTRRWWSGLTGRNRGRTVRVTVTYRDLDAIALSGAVRLSATALDTPQLRVAASGGSAVRIDELRTDMLRVIGSGALKAELGGHATEQRISINGAGDYDAERLSGDHANVSVSGVGHVVVRVAKTLSASISGAGSVEYYGDPEVKEHVSGVGRIKRREAVAPVGRGIHFAAWPALHAAAAYGAPI
jgi:hypothetical protein